MVLVVTYLFKIGTEHVKSLAKSAGVIKPTALIIDVQVNEMKDEVT